MGQTLIKAFRSYTDELVYDKPMLSAPVVDDSVVVWCTPSEFHQTRHQVFQVKLAQCEELMVLFEP